MYKNMWDWLEIEPTDDEAVIKKAFSEMSKKYHPVEYPEQFQQLRDSYKNALAYAKRKKERAKTTYTSSEKAGYEFDDYGFGDEESENDFGENAKSLDGADAKRISDDGADTKIMSDEEKQQYTFDDYLSDNYTPHQMDLYNIVKHYCELSLYKPKVYGCVSALEILMSGWEKNPISEHLTSGLVSDIIELFELLPFIDKKIIKLLEKKLIQNRNDTEFNALRNKLYKLYNPEIKSAINSKYNFSRSDANLMLRMLSDHGAVTSFKGISLPHGIYIPLGGRFVLGHYYLYVFSATGVKCYLLRDTTYDINESTRRLTIRDINGKKIISFSINFYCYDSILVMLINSTSKAVKEPDIDVRTHIMPYKPLSNGKVKFLTNYCLWAKELLNLKLLLTSGVILFIAFYFSWLMPDRSSYYDFGPVIEAFIFILGIIGHPVAIISFFCFLVYGIRILQYLISFLTLDRALVAGIRGDIAAGKAIRLSKGDINFFEDCMLIVDKRGLHLIDYAKIKECDVFGEGKVLPSGQKSKVPGICIKFVEGRSVEYFHALPYVLDNLKEIIDERVALRISGKKDYVMKNEYIHERYLRLLTKRKFHLPSKYLLDSTICGYYLSQYILLAVAAVIAFGGFCVVIASESEAEFEIGGMVFGGGVIVCIITMLNMLSFIAIPKDYKIEAMIQTMYLDVPKKNYPTPYVCDDFFVFVRYLALHVYKYEDIEWLSRDGFIKLKNKKRIYSIIRPEPKAYDQYSDEKTIKDVLDLVSYKHPEVKIVGRGKDYDSWNRFRNNK